MPQHTHFRGNEDYNIVWHAKNKYYEADINVHVSNHPVSDNCRVPPIGAIVYYTDKIPLLPGKSEENDDVNFISSLDRWLNSYIKKRFNTLKSDSAENQNADVHDLAETDSLDAEDVRLIIVESFLSNDTKSNVLNWALDKGKDTTHFW